MRFLNLKLLITILLISQNAYTKEIPVVVIAPSKKPQSISTVGTSVTILDEKFISNSNEYFLGDTLSSYSTSTNFFQSGGYGTTSAIQLRGLPKRYSTVYIDGVKMTDPSSVTGEFDFNNILNGNLSRVEILKGNQSSVYGSGAIGGTINITTKKGEPGFNKDIKYSSGSNGTHDLLVSFSGADEKNDFYVGLQRFQTDGISQMLHNDEKDRYRNNSVIANYGYKFSNKLQLNNNLRISETYLQYDAVSSTSGYDNAEEADAVEGSYNLSLTHNTSEKFINKLSFANTYIKRIYGAAPKSKNTKKDKYYGERNAFYYSGNYNFDLDNSIVFGFEREDDEMGYNPDLSGTSYEHSYTESKYFDFQKRFSKNIYTTFGSRFDEHSVAGNEEAHRATFAYLLDNKETKFKASIGTGFRFPSLYEMYYVYGATKSGSSGVTSSSLPFVKAENSLGFDFGIEKFFTNLNINLEATYFNLKYEDALEGWKIGNSSGINYTTQNIPGTVKSQGIEIISNWIKSKSLSFNLNYTYTSTYDGAEQDDPDKSSSYYNAQLVRVPRHLVNINTTYTPKNIENTTFTLSSKWADTTRDYGNGNRTFSDERTDDFFVNDLSINHNLFNKYNIFLDVTNLLDERYETVRDYSQLGRSFNFGIKQDF